MKSSILSPVGVLEALKQITEKYKEDLGIKEADVSADDAPETEQASTESGQ